MQEVGLVLVGVVRLLQHRARGPLFEPRIVARGEALRTEPRGVFQAQAELDFAIAQHVGVGRAAGAILGEEVIEHAVAVGGGEAHPMQRDADFRGRGTRVLEVLCIRAIGVVVLPVAHVEPVHVVAGALQQQRGHGGIHAAGHADDDASGRILCRGGHRAIVPRADPVPGG